MMKIIAEQEHNLLVSAGAHFTVVERRAGKFYPLCSGTRHGHDVEDVTVAQLISRIRFVFRVGCARPSGSCCFAMAGAIRTRPLRRVGPPYSSCDVYLHQIACFLKDLPGHRAPPGPHRACL
jgi:hypothetical protein